MKSYNSDISVHAIGFWLDSAHSALLMSDTSSGAISANVSGREWSVLHDDRTRNEGAMLSRPFI
jgi:hypothetical protein